MSYQVLARKYRPQKFSEVIGQEHVTQTLKNAIEQERIAHGYIFSGHRGIGKTTVARILAMALNCRSAAKPIPEPCGVCESCTEIRAGSSVDVIEIDAATNRGIDEIRELREAARYRPARDRFKIYILDEAHQITDAAFNALLKTLEEPPGHVIFMLATTQPEDIPQTIRSRCQHFSFRAVKFEDILGQLRDISRQERIAADEDALALLAEAGDGSMRDALSILDQAIASTAERLTLEAVQRLVGAAPAAVLENLMQAVAQNSSEKALLLVDEIIREGHSAVHFARQLVRFLRNVTVAKIAGKDSPLLQISSDERERAQRVAEVFSEEDLARHLQIMLRTHGDLAYRHEQRFHLELGLLKMVHAQRLLPIEQLLSEATPGAPAQPRQGGKPTLATVPAAADQRGRDSRSSNISPFAADSARKGTPRMETAGDPTPMVRTGMISGGAAAVVVMGATVPQPSEMANPQPASSAAVDVEALREAALGALTDQPMLVSMMEAGQWKLEGNSLLVSVAAAEVIIEMSFGADARRVASAAASGRAGRPIKVQVLPGGTAQPVSEPRRSVSNGSARSRAEQEPVVRRMQEKFGAEIRTVIDYRDMR
jgi:DNA polymerase-3 subunit gamma/tau